LSPCLYVTGLLPPWAIVCLWHQAKVNCLRMIRPLYDMKRTYARAAPMSQNDPERALTLYALGIRGILLASAGLAMSGADSAFDGCVASGPPVCD